MPTINDRWHELASVVNQGRSVTRLRVAPESPHDLYIAVIQPGTRRCFWYDVPSACVPNDYRLPALRSVKTSMRPLDDIPARTRIEMELVKLDLAEVYEAMISDLVGAVAATPDDDSGLSALCQRTERWRQLLELDGTAGLSVADRRGLMGELLVLDELLDIGASAFQTIATWTGPYNAHQDFQGSHAALEVKTTVVKQPQSLIISSERELDDTGVPHLYLMHLSLDERHGGSGQSLNALVDVVRSRLAGDAMASAAFEGALLNRGYLRQQASLYEAPNYSLRDQNAFEVRDGFPCITENDIPTGVGDVAYRIQLAALQPYAVPTDAALTTVVAP